MYAIMMSPHKFNMHLWRSCIFILVKMQTSSLASSYKCKNLCGSKSKSHFSVCVTSVAHTFLFKGKILLEKIKKYWTVIFGILLTGLAFKLKHPLILFTGIVLLIISLFLFPIKAINKYNEKHNKHYYPSFVIIFIICSLIYATLTVLIIGFINNWNFSPEEVTIFIILSLLFSGLYGYLYFLPYLIANKKNHLQTRAIYILNIFAGWTILAWVIALIWANTEPKSQTVIQQTTSQSNADEIKKYKDLLDSGVITHEEYDAKKKQLLGL